MPSCGMVLFEQYGGDCRGGLSLFGQVYAYVPFACMVELCLEVEVLSHAASVAVTSPPSSEQFEA